MAGIIQDDNKVGGVPQSSSKRVALSTCFDVFLNGETHIGFISSITANHNRTVTQIRHLNSVDAGIAVDTSVMADAPTLSFNGFYVYANRDSDTNITVSTGDSFSNGEIGIGPSAGRLAGIQLLMSLDQQNIPFDIVLSHRYPSNTSKGPGFKVTDDDAASGIVIGAYRNCTISSMTIPINIGTAAVTDSGNISVGYIANSVTI